LSDVLQESREEGFFGYVPVAGAGGERLAHECGLDGFLPECFDEPVIALLLVQRRGCDEYNHRPEVLETHEPDCRLEIHKLLGPRVHRRVCNLQHPRGKAWVELYNVLKLLKVEPDVRLGEGEDLCRNFRHNWQMIECIFVLVHSLAII